MKISSTILLLSISLLCSAQIVKHERLLSFEDKVPSFVTGKNSQLSISSNHYKDGEQSLLWSFSPLGEFSIKKDLKFEPKDPTGKDTYLSTFVVWVYNENPIDDVVQFEFLKDGRKCTSFPFKINYKGWRAAWVCFERDMEGIPEEGMNEVRIIAPNTQGRLYVDHIITAVKSDHRYQSPDLQAPFVNKKTEHNWLHILRYSGKTPDIVAEPVTTKQKEEIQQIEKRFVEITYTPSGFSAAEMNAIKKSFAAYNIRYQNGQVIGLPIFYTRSTEAYERLIPNCQNIYSLHGMDLGQYFTLMNRIAIAYNNAQTTTDKTELKEMFLKMYDHIVDQGVDYGSCLGNITHFGYSFRNYFTACFLMKDVFAEAGHLSDVVKMMVWYAMTKEVFVKPQVEGMDMDAFNTLTNGKVASMMLMEDSPEKVQYLKSFSRWINNGCLPAKGLEDSFKTDGSAYHHCNLYPAYAVGGFTGATNMIYLLNRTSFAVSELGHSTVKNALQTMRFYCNKTHFPLALSGRHPNGKGELIPVHYATMAIAGTPDGASVLDTEMAATFLRLKSGVEDDSPKPEYMPVKTKNEQRLYDLFVSKGLKAEKDPSGNIALPYGCTSVQRRDNWSAVVRGHSRYLWAAEHYRGANLYGRYLAHGSMQILTAPSNKEVTPSTSGWVEEGFDWGRIPGATAIHLPVEQLKANVLNVDIHSGFEEMLYSDEAFAGGISQNKMNGAFGMKLHEHDKYNGSLRARKSYHFFDGVIVCLGSDIENLNNDYNTETTVFQLAATDNSSTEYWNSYNQNKEAWVDHLGIGYYIPNRSENTFVFEKNFPQKSRKQNTGEETSENWVSLVLDHGKSPKGKSYEYAVIPKSSSENIKLFAKKPTYKVLQKDRNAHIVKDILSSTTSYVLFETPRLLPKGIIQSVDTACLVMVKEDKKELSLTVCNPDLAFYRGDSDEKLDDNGKRTERSIYSRPWIGNESGEIPVTVTLNGMWNITNAQENCKLISSDKNKTVLLFTCKDGASFDVRLKSN